MTIAQQDQSAVEKHIELPIQGMDCNECTLNVQRAIAALPGVHQVDVFLGAEKAVVDYDAQQLATEQIHAAVRGAGYEAPERTKAGDGAEEGRNPRRTWQTMHCACWDWWWGPCCSWSWWGNGWGSSPRSRSGYRGRSVGDGFGGLCAC